MRRINTSTVRRFTRGVALNRIKRLTTRKVGQIEEFLQRCRETQDSSLSFISDNELIQIATEKLPAIIKDNPRFSTYRTFEEFYSVMVRWEKELLAPFDWPAYENELNMLGLRYLIPLMKEFAKYCDPHEFGTTKIVDIIYKFPYQYAQRYTNGYDTERR